MTTKYVHLHFENRICALFCTITPVFVVFMVNNIKATNINHDIAQKTLKCILVLQSFSNSVLLTLFILCFIDRYVHAAVNVRSVLPVFVPNTSPLPASSCVPSPMVPFMCHSICFLCIRLRPLAITSCLAHLNRSF